MTEVTQDRRPALRLPGRRSPVFHGWRIVAVLAFTETVSWGVLYYAFAVFQVPMGAELGLSSAQLTGAFSVAVLITGVAGVWVGRWLDVRGPRGLMTAGAAVSALLVAAWSQVQSAAGLYLVFAGIGLARATVLYEPAFAVIVRWFERQRANALLAVTLVAGFASTIALPTSNALAEALGWRDALLVLPWPSRASPQRSSSSRFISSPSSSSRVTRPDSPRQPPERSGRSRSPGGSC